MGIYKQLPHLGAGRGVHRARNGASSQLPAMVIGGGAGVHGFTYGQTCAERRDGLRQLMQALADRLCRVRIACGDWTRVCGPSVTTKHGLTAVLLDPPYELSERHAETYTHETDCAAAVREWAIEHGDDPLLRIAYCGYDDGREPFPETWECFAWKAQGGYGSQGNGRGRENSQRERIWFNKNCLRPERARQMSLVNSLFDDGG